MGLQHEQYYCKRCDRLTLHVRNRVYVPHFGYILMITFGIVADLGFVMEFGGLPMWWLHQSLFFVFLAWVAHSAASVGASQTYRCSDCGEPASPGGSIPPPSSPAPSRATPPGARPPLR